jgi:hypothetical protein
VPRGRRAGVEPSRGSSRRHLEDDIQLDRSAERKAGDAIDRAAGALVPSEHVVQELRSAIGDFGVLADLAGGGHRDGETDDPPHLVERSQVAPRDRENVERGEVGRLPSRVDVELRSDPSDERRTASLRGKSIPLRRSRWSVCTAST